MKTPPMPKGRPAYTISQLALGSWALFGVMVLLGRALYRLAPIAWEPLGDGSMRPHHYALYVVWVLVNGYTEGHRGFEKRFVPRVLGRITFLVNNPTPLRVFLAPFFSMGYFDAKKRVMLSAWGISIAVVFAVAFVRHIPQPWRGIIDAGVVAGLGYGLATLLAGSIGLLRGTFTPADPEVPMDESEANAIEPPLRPESAASR